LPALVRGRWLIVAAAILAASGFALSVHGGAWWSIDVQGASVQIGPYGSQRCFEGKCAQAGLGWIGANERWLRIGIATWAAGLLSMFVMLALAGGVAAKRVPKYGAKFSVGSLLAATLSGGAFIALFPTVQHAAVSRGIVLYVGALALAMVVTVAVLRAPLPPDDDGK
jgi:cytochrome bd-type quinol oxidase subunit 2